MGSFSQLKQQIKNCSFCASQLLLPPKPVVQLDPRAKMLVIAQAPGIRARTSGLVFDDPSGDRLRAWLGIDRTFFYDQTKIAFMPMGFCYPGSKNGLDLPPCTECAPLWHHQIVPHLRNIELTLLVGSYAHRYYLQGKSMNDVLKKWRANLPDILPLPHPSWHNSAWLNKNPWFFWDVIPYLKNRMHLIFKV